MRERTRWLAEEWAVQLGPAIGSMTGERARAEASAGDTAIPQSAEVLYWCQTLDAAPDAAIWLAVSPDVWQTIGQRVLESAGLADAGISEVRSTFVEVLQQSVSPLCSSLGSKLGREVQCREGGEFESAPPSLFWQRVELDLGQARSGSAWIACSEELLHVLRPGAGGAGGGSSSPPADGDSDVSGLQKPSRTLDLLMEVELPVGVSFGRVQMRLKDAIKLTTGSIVELNRSVSEPVEIIVNNCVIARGEVVVVEGNYGVRIKHIISREERLRTLF